MVPDPEQRSVSDNAQYLIRYLRTLYTFRVCLLAGVPLESYRCSLLDWEPAGVPLVRTGLAPSFQLACKVS